MFLTCTNPYCTHSTFLDCSLFNSMLLGYFFSSGGCIGPPAGSTGMCKSTPVVPMILPGQYQWEGCTLMVVLLAMAKMSPVVPAGRRR